nr:hypothetical protein FVER53263_08500 [Fusarium verticillioides]
MCSASFPPPGGMSSFWRTEPGNLDNYRSTTELPTSVDIAIVGAGYSAASILTHILATTSKNERPSILVLEARQLCSGATGRNGGHLKPDSYNAISGYTSEYGIEAAAEVASFEAANVKAVTEYVQQNKIDCDFVLTRAVDVQLSTGHQHRIKEGYDKLIAAGIETTKDTFCVEGKDAEMMSGVKGAKGCFTYTAGHLWPYKLIHHMFSEAIKRGINLQTNTPVTSVSDTQDATGHWTLHTSRGEVRARKVVFVTNAYTGSLLPEYKSKIIPYRAVCSRIKTPGPHPLLNNTYALRFSDWNFDYLIPRLDGSIIVGGARDAYIRSVDSWYGNVDDTQVIKEARSYFDGYMQRHFHGWEDSRAYVDDVWTGIMGYSSDRLPRVGPIPGRPGMFIMGGFTGHGRPGPRDAHHEIILGDVIVSQSVVQYDLGRQYPATFEYKDTNEEALGRPNVEIRSLLSKLKSLRARRAFESDMRKFLSILQEDRELAAHYPEPGTDRLFEATYRHVDNDVPCDKCGCNGKLVPRQRLRQGVPEPRVHFGRIASGDTVMKSGEDRDDIARKLGVIAFEMESAGVWDSLPCLVVKGACDYADSHKAKATQNYAAATAAACTKAILRHWVVSTPPVLVPFPPNDDFVGRQDIIGNLRQQLSPEKSHAVAAVFGLGGVGKTQIALAYVHELHAQSPDLSIFWVYASNEERMRQAYANIMQQLKIPSGGENSDVLERVKQWLEAQHHKPWLMVIDNVDELDLFYGTGGLGRYFPTCAHGKLLITTRNRQVAVRATKGRGFIEVSRMTDCEARELLCAHLGCLESDIADLSTLALKLEYLPLILVQAAAFIQENSISVREYLALLKNDKNMVELLNEDFETSGKDPDSLRAVARTWMISFRQIRHQNKLAGELLSLVAKDRHIGLGL